MPSIVLASGSAYRSELLKKLQLDFTTCGSHIDETPLANETAYDLALRLAVAKARSVSKQWTESLIIGSDQTADCGGQFLHKPGNRETAIQQLCIQSGRSVIFYTGLILLDSASGKQISTVETCTVHFRKLSLEQITYYVDKERPFDCAGAFKSEGLGIALFKKIESDDPNTLIGLPLIKLIELLNEFGVDVLKLRT